MKVLVRLLAFALGPAVGLVLLGPARALAAEQSPGPPAIPWTWSSQPDLYPLVDLIASQGHQRISLHERWSSEKPHESTAELAYSLEKGGVRSSVWKTVLPDAGSGEITGAALVLTSSQVFIARYNRIATGCTLYAFSLTSGKLQWKVPLLGIGPVAHSKWYNRLQLSMVGEHLIVFGNEGPTRAYIERRNAAFTWSQIRYAV